MTLQRTHQLFLWNDGNENLTGITIKTICRRGIAENQLNTWVDKMVGATDCFYFLSEECRSLGEKENQWRQILED